MKWLRENKAVLWAAAALIAAVLCLALGGEKTGGASQEEKRIAQVLSAIEGAGRVEVALYYTKEQESALGGLQSARPSRSRNSRAARAAWPRASSSRSESFPGATKSTRSRSPSTR